MQYRFGTFTSPGTAAAQTITLGFQPSKFILTNYTGYGTATVVSQGIYYSGMTAAYALIQTVATDADVTGNYLVPTILTSNGFTVFSNGAQYTNTIKNIIAASKANPCVIQTSASHGYTTGDTITISNVVGMVQLNTNRYKVVVIDADEFSLQDLFGNAVDSTGYGTYVSGGECNLISNTLTPPGNVYDTGSQGITLGTSLFRNNADVFYWEAFYQTPTGW